MLRKLSKIFFILLLMLIVAAVSVIAIAQTKWFKKELEISLQDAAKKSGLYLSIGDIEGSIPLKWKLTKVILQKKGEFSLSIQEAKIRLALLPLLQKKIVISYLKTAEADLHFEKEHQWKLNTSLFDSLSSFPYNLSIRSFHIDHFTIRSPQDRIIADFTAQGKFLLKKRAKKVDIELRYRDMQSGDEIEIAVNGKRVNRQLALNANGHFWRSVAPSWDFEADFLVYANKNLEIKSSSLQSELGKLKISGKFEPDFTPTEGTIALNIPHLQSFSKTARGEIDLHATLAAGHFLGEIEAQQITAGPLHVGSCSSSVTGYVQNGLWQGIVEGTAKSGGSSILIHSAFSYDQAVRRLDLPEIDLEAPAFASGGSMALNFSPFASQGDLRLQALDLQALRPFFPSCHLDGKCGGSVHFEKEKIRADLFGSELEFRDMHIGCIDLQIEFMGAKEGKVDVEAERIYFPEAYLSSFRLSSASNDQGWPISLETEGTWKYPFKLKADAIYQNRESKHQFAVEKLDALFLEQPFHLVRPLNMVWQDKMLRIDDLALLVGSGRLEGQFNKTEEELSLSLHGDKLPMSWIAVLTPYLTLEGESSLDCKISATNETLQGFCRIDSSRIEAVRRGETAPLYAKGTIEVHLSNKTLQMSSILEASENQVMLVHLSLPISYTLSPISLKLEKDRPLSGSFEIEGKLQEIYTFASTGSQSLSGWASGKMLLFGTLEKPQLQGSLHLEDASYANHFIGLEFTKICADLHAQKETIFIDELIASDGKKGTLKMQGEFQIDAKEHFPYRFTGQFEHFDAIDLDLVNAKLTGPATLTGNFQKALLEGTFNVDSAEVGIPKSLPADLPDLPYTFSGETLNEEEERPRGFPFSFDIVFDSADTIVFQGNGLTSTWGGKIHLHGVGQNLLASGTLRLTKGHFQILGKNFLLQQGELTFSDKPGQEGFINLTGTLNTHDATITAQLRGPLSSPQLSFHSAPALTTNEIFSLLLFNKRVSEIKPVQAVQLAHTVLTFYGHTGWNPVSQIGTGLNALGIDTFDIIPSEEGLKQSSITIGKHFYLVRNMLVTLTQSRDSRRFLVEVDIGKGFLFQAENLFGPDQSQQEGKFSLKWNKNY